MADDEGGTVRPSSDDIEDVLERQVRPRLRGHAGDLEIDSITDDGTVVVRFTGACVGCPNQPMTMEALVAPALEAVEGVQQVERPGNVRVSESARRRIRELFGSAYS